MQLASPVPSEQRVGSGTDLPEGEWLLNGPHARSVNKQHGCGFLVSREIKVDAASSVVLGGRQIQFSPHSFLIECSTCLEQPSLACRHQRSGAHATKRNPPGYPQLPLWMKLGSPVRKEASKRPLMNAFSKVPACRGSMLMLSPVHHCVTRLSTHRRHSQLSTTISISTTWTLSTWCP